MAGGPVGPGVELLGGGGGIVTVCCAVGTGGAAELGGEDDTAGVGLDSVAGMFSVDLWVCFWWRLLDSGGGSRL